MTMTRMAKKAITPKQKKVTVLSVVGPARPTPSSARAAGTASSSIVSAASSAAPMELVREGIVTPCNLAQQTAAISSSKGRSPTDASGPFSRLWPGEPDTPQIEEQEFPRY